jgi:hypothetical protein
MIVLFAFVSETLLPLLTVIVGTSIGFVMVVWIAIAAAKLFKQIG